MAIFGDLATMSTPDVLKMLGSRTGKLFIRSTTHKQYELHLHQGAVLCFREDDVSVKVKDALHKSLVELFGLRQGKFDFGPMHKAVLSHEIHVSRQEVWQLLATTAVEDPKDPAGANSATDKTTRFKLKDSSRANSELPANLQSFLQRSRVLLAAGCSASELAEVVKLPVPLVQLYLLRLRSLDVITPVRAYAVNYRGYSGSRGDADTSGGFGDDNGAGHAEREGRLESPPGLAPGSGALAETTGTTLSAPVPQPPAAWSSQQPARSAVTPTSAPAPTWAQSSNQSASNPQPVSTQQTLVESPAPRQSFIRRLLSVFSFGGK